MRFFFFISFLFVTLFAFEQKTKLGVEGIAYNNYSNEIATLGNTKLSYENEYFKTDATVEFLYSSEYKKRRYLLLNELYLTKEFDDYSFTIGKELKYWGELEGYNIADVYNQKNYFKDPFDKSAKLGSIGANITRYFEENSLELGVKLYEQDINYPQNEMPYAPLPMDYTKKLQTSDARYTPTFYLKANFVTDELVDSETSLIFWHGYDTKRYFTPISSTTLAQYAYRVKKVLLFSHIVVGDTIFKTELAYTDVSKDTKMSDYTQLSVGAEHSVYDIFGSDITFYGEYYKYLYTDDKKIKNVDISEVYDNDIFLALRLNFNDIGSSDMKFGILQDLDKAESVFKVDFHSRVRDDFVLHGEFLEILSSTRNATLLSQFADSQRFIFGIDYTF
jgi:hypothetical protein